MSTSLKYLIIFGVVYILFKGYLFYRLNRTLKEFAEKAAAAKGSKNERPVSIDGQTIDPASRQGDL